jgi:thiol-disulfide isomerase/thioredoxin
MTDIIKVNIVRGAVALALLAGLFLILFLVLLPRGEDDSVDPAVMLDTRQGAGDVEVGVHTGDLARNFEASDLQNVRHTLEELRGRPVVINFWATWCASCVAEMPSLDEERLARGDEDLAIVAVNVGEQLSAAEEFIASLELYDFIVAMDTDLAISDAYSVRGMPHSVFIDRDGVIQAEYRGQLDDATLGDYIQAAIEAVPGEPPPTNPRFVTTIPREHILEAVKDPVLDDAALFISRRFRCDDDYCGQPIAQQVRGVDGVLNADIRTDGPEPALIVTYDAETLNFDELVDAVAAIVGAYEDPLYTRELEVHIAG